MAVYRIGDILRMKREALGITREKLCEMSGEICSPKKITQRMEHMAPAVFSIGSARDSSIKRIPKKEQAMDTM